MKPVVLEKKPAPAKRRAVCKSCSYVAHAPFASSVQTSFWLKMKHGTHMKQIVWHNLFEALEPFAVRDERRNGKSLKGFKARKTVDF